MLDEAHFHQVEEADDSGSLKVAPYDRANAHAGVAGDPTMNTARIFHAQQARSIRDAVETCQERVRFYRVLGAHDESL
jgi:hypothetical protein